jgi:DinB family protein
MNAECVRIADQLRRAFGGDAWHGAPLRDLLAGLSADQAGSRPIPSAHTIWELVLHIHAWVNAAGDAVEGIPMPKLVGTDADWPHLADRSGAAWSRATDDLFRSAERLAAAVERFEDGRLPETVPGRSYDFYHLFHGIVQHSLYHGGQIALLKKAVTG